MTISSRTRSIDPGDSTSPPVSEFLERLSFDRGAPAALKRAARRGDATAFVKEWFAALASRCQGQKLQWPQSAWNWMDVDPRLARAWRSAASNARRRATMHRPPRSPNPLRLISDLPRDCPDTDLLLVLALLTRRPKLTASSAWLAAWRHAITLAADRPMTAELAATSGLLLSPLAGTRQLRRDGLAVLSGQVLEITDSNGTPAAASLEDIPDLLASLVRVHSLATQLGQKPWNKDVTQRLGIVLHLARQLATRGSSYHATASATGRPSSSGLDSLLAAATDLLPSRQVVPAGIATQSDWARLAMLSTDSSNTTSPLCSAVLTHDQPTPRLEVSIGDTSLISGNWTLEVRRGKTCWKIMHWDCVCWHSDEDADYIEIQADVGDGQRVDRQLLLDRQNHLLLLGDTVVTPPTSESQHQPILSCRAQVTMAHGIKSRPHRSGHRDWRMAGHGIVARAIPLVLPDDPLLSAGPSECQATDSQLAWQHMARGPGLYLPVIIDLAPCRQRRRAEWAPVSITEQRRIVPTAHASAFHARIGDRHWLIYRSLVRSHAARAVLGQHTDKETMVAVFDNPADVTPLVMVDAPPLTSPSHHPSS